MVEQKEKEIFAFHYLDFLIIEIYILFSSHPPALELYLRAVPLISIQKAQAVLSYCHCQRSVAISS